MGDIDVPLRLYWSQDNLTFDMAKDIVKQDHEFSDLRDIYSIIYGTSQYGH